VSGRGVKTFQGVAEVRKPCDCVKCGKSQEPNLSLCQVLSWLAEEITVELF